MFFHGSHTKIKLKTHKIKGESQECKMTSINIHLIRKLTKRIGSSSTNGSSSLMTQIRSKNKHTCINKPQTDINTENK